MIDFDLMVTWRRADGSTVELPATVCYRDEQDDRARRGEAIVDAIEANTVDFPDDLGDDAVPVSVRIEAP